MMMLQEIKKHQSQKNFGIAFEKCKELLNKDCVDDELYYLTGMALKGMEEIDLSQNYFIMCLQFKPDHAPTLSQMGQLYYDRGNYDDSTEVFKKLLDINPKHSTSHFYLGKLSQKSNRLEEALFHYQECLKIKPHFRKCRRALVRVQRKIESDKNFSNLDVEGLKTKVIQLQEALNLKANEGVCVVCLQRQSIFANVACGHCCICGDCLPSIRKKCPLCNVVGNYIKIYRG